MKFLCPLCKKQEAYISEYGLADSVICKCEGLQEVGRYTKGVFYPHQILVERNQPQPKLDVDETLLEFQARSRSNRLPSGREQFAVGQFSIHNLITDDEVKAAGDRFENALQSPLARKDYMAKGTIYIAENLADSSRDIIFFIDNQKRLQNFYLYRNGTPDPVDGDIVKNELRRLQKIIN